MNKERSIKIEQSLYEVIKLDSFNDFTIMQLRDAYKNTSDVPMDAVEARKFVYRQILRFMRLGLFKKEAAANARDTKYHKTSKFFKTNFTIRSQVKVPQKSPTSLITKNEGLVEIKEQLKQYKVDLLASIGESEEYMRLYTSNPEFKALLEAEYYQARDQSSKLLGQIKALKTVLTHYSN